MYWASWISNIGLQMAIPPLAGWWLDSWWGTTPWLLIAGAVLGFSSTMLAILKLASRFDERGSDSLPGDAEPSDRPRRQQDG